jgi:hypothetical protein
VDNLLKIMSLSEENMHSVMFVTPDKEGGFSVMYDPANADMNYQVFIHNRFPYKTILCKEFRNFTDARRYAAEEAFRRDWEILSWDQNAKRPCGENGGQECGSGSCEMCKTTGGGCKSCGASDESFVK